MKLILMRVRITTRIRFIVTMRRMTMAREARAGGASATVLAIRVAALLAVLWAATPAQAGPVLALDAQARAAVANDEMVVVLAVERDGAQVGPLNDAVLSQLNAAIAEALGAGDGSTPARATP